MQIQPAPLSSPNRHKSGSFDLWRPLPFFLLEAEMEQVVWRDAAILRFCKVGEK